MLRRPAAGRITRWCAGATGSRVRVIASAIVASGLLGCTDTVVAPEAALHPAAANLSVTSSKLKGNQKPVAIHVSAGDGQQSPVLTQLPDSLVVRIVDRQGAGVPDQQVNFSVISGSGQAGPAAVLTDGLGYARAAWTLGGQAGEQQLAANAGGTVGSVTFTADALPAGSAVLHVAGGDGQEGTAGKALAFPLQVVLLDESGEPVSGARVTWSVVSGGGSVEAEVATTGADGRSTARWTLGGLVGEQRALAAVNGLSALYTAAAHAAPPAVVAVIVEPGSVTFDALNAVTRLSAVAKDAAGATVTGATFQWTSSSSSVASVDAMGEVTAKAVGTALIIATAAGVADTALVTVRQVPAQVQLGSTAVSLVVNATEQLHATVYDAGGAVIPAAPVSWASSASSIATVSSAGLVTGVAPGAATVTAASGTASTTATATVEAPETPPPPQAAGIWMSKAEILTLPVSGTSWKTVRDDAARDHGSANIADQNSRHDIYTLAAAFTCVRTGEFCTKARAGVLAAIGTEHNNQPGTTTPGAWLEVGRNLAAYVIAADVLGMRADGDESGEGSRVETWIRSWLTKQLPDNITGVPRTFGPFHSGSNAAAQEGFAYATVAAYLGDREALDRAWDAYRRFAGDPSAPDRENIDLRQGVKAGWAHDDARPFAINPKGTAKRIPSGMPGAGTTVRIDGAIINDQRRGGDLQWEPGYTQYPWTGLAGLVPAAVILQRAGYPAFEVADRAVLRTHDYLWFLRTATGNTAWFDGVRGSEVVQLVNHYYGTAFTVSQPVSRGFTIGYTDWTHARR
jgi:hypothetical protein